MNTLSLTANELEIIEVMWKMNKPLSKTEILNLTPNRSWSKTSIHPLLNKLLEKGAIKVDGFVQTNKNYGRIYSPLITQDEYILSTFNQIKQSPYYATKTSVVTSIFAALIQDNDIDDELLDELEQMIERRKQENK